MPPRCWSNTTGRTITVLTIASTSILARSGTAGQRSWPTSCGDRRTLDEIVVTAAWTCTKMRSDGFGGSIMRITATGIQHCSTSDMLEALREQPISPSGTDVDGHETRRRHRGDRLIGELGQLHAAPARVAMARCQRAHREADRASRPAGRRRSQLTPAQAGLSTQPAIIRACRATAGPMKRAFSTGDIPMAHDDPFHHRPFRQHRIVVGPRPRRNGFPVRRARQ